MTEVLERIDLDELIGLIEKGETSPREIDVKIGFVMGVLKSSSHPDGTESICKDDVEVTVFAPWWSNDYREDFDCISEWTKLPHYTTSLDAAVQLVDRRQEGVVLDAISGISARFGLDRMEQSKDKSLTEYLAQALVIKILQNKRQELS